MARRLRLDRELERYLVDGETIIVAVRLHWVHLAREILIAAAATAFAFWVDVKVPLTPAGELLHNASLLLWWGAALWLLWRVLNWAWFVAIAEAVAQSAKAVNPDEEATITKLAALFGVTTG